MSRAMLLNGCLNAALVVIFVALNQWTLRSHLEETFVALALIYGCIVTLGNALFVSRLKRA